MERIVLTTGGTGGHIFPALAVIEELRERHPGLELLFVGSEYGPEAALMQRAQVPFVALPVRGFQGRGLKALGAAVNMLRGTVCALGLLRKFKPELVVGFGGYAAFATVLAARMQGLPTAIHEQNALAGLSNRLLGKIVRRVMCSLPDTRGFAPGKTVLVGNPIRRAVLAAGVGERGGRGKRLFVMGGSQGARAINELIIRALPLLSEAGVELWHQTGAAEHQRICAAYAASAVEARVEPFVHDMGQAYAWADLALCRAGATSVAELAACGLPAVFVPFPYAAHDHQTKNAELVASHGAALVFAESCGQEAVKAALTLLNAPERLAAMSAAFTQLARPDAAAVVAKQLEELVCKTDMA